MRSEIPILASATLKVIKKYKKKFLIKNFVFNIILIKKIFNINNSKIINNIIIWNHIETYINIYQIISINITNKIIYIIFDKFWNIINKKNIINNLIIWINLIIIFYKNTKILN